MQALSFGIQAVLSGYYASAPHRQAVSLPDPLGGRPLHYFRAMCHFEPAAPFLNVLRTAGYSPNVFRLPRDEESYLLDPWSLTAMRAIEHFANHPETVGERPVFVGHSAGGFSAYLLGALSVSDDVPSFRRVIADLAPFRKTPSVEALRNLADALRSALFVSIGTPYQGVKLARIGRLLNRHLFQTQTPLLIDGLRKSYLHPLYARIGARPGRVIHGQMISPEDPIALSLNPSSLAYETILQGGMRVVARLTEFDLYDGIAPWSATYVPEISEREVLALDHLRLVETADPALRLIRLIERLGRRTRP